MTTLPWILFALTAAALAVALARRRRASHPGAPAPAADGPAADVPGQRRELAFALTPRPAVVVDADGRVIDLNREAQDRFPFLVPGRTLLESFGNHELAGGVASAVRGRRRSEFSIRLVADGRHTYEVSVEPFEVAGRREALVLLADVTEAVAYQDLRSQFVANVSHELRTPLTGLRGMLEALEDGGMDTDTQTRFAGRARQEAERLEALITDILFLSELEAGEGIPSREVSDLCDAARRAADAVAPQADAAGVRVTVDAPGPCLTPLTERMAVTVVANLLENAVRYSGRGSAASAVVRREDGRVVLEVSDDGAGIPDRHLPHVFERFYRVDPSRSKELGGTGLGLSIVKHIAERFGGGVEVRSREGFGTTFRVTLPPAAPR